MTIILGVSIQGIFRHDFSETGTVSVRQVYRSGQETILLETRTVPDGMTRVSGTFFFFVKNKNPIRRMGTRGGAVG
jgi:hypothetical protein